MTNYENQAGGGDKPVQQYQCCTVSDSDCVRVITLNQPEIGNSLTPDNSHELERIWTEFSERNDLWVAIITGAGDKAFCGGHNLKAHARGNRKTHPISGFGGNTLREDILKPTIAAVNGAAIGGGFEIALACDLIVASENATFALPETRFGLLPIMGGLHRLPRIIPAKRALGMILTGNRVSAQQGLDYGFVNEVVPVGQALVGAMRWAEHILECSPMATRAAKEAVYLGLAESDIYKNMRTVFPAQKANLESQDYIEGPRAFAERRKPQWQNR